MSTTSAHLTLVDKINMQNRLFSELSLMFGKEVPLYDKSLAVNRECNLRVCALLGAIFPGFAISDDDLERTSGERHGAIRIGKPDEYRWMTRFFACFAMHPHNYYDMSRVGAKSQPIIATAFRSVFNPEHRVFCSLLQTDYFDPDTRRRIEALLATREVFTPRAKELIEQSERDGGLSSHDADALIRQGCDHIFKWTGKARDYPLYNHLCDAGFKIAADIACFERHHLNHLTPNTFCMDLYTAAMKFAMGELTQDAFGCRAIAALERLAAHADHHFLRLCFRHLSDDEIERLPRKPLEAGKASQLADDLTARLERDDLNLTRLTHAGFKDFTEGPSEDTPILLRQDAYKALTEPVTFHNADGSQIHSSHTARFGEIEQRFYATTPKGRELYDVCLAQAEDAKEKDPGLIKRDFAGYERAYAQPFAAFPKTLPELFKAGLVYGRFSPTSKGIAAKGSINTTDLFELAARGFVRAEGLRYEDFLPVSAAGIFASNLNQYGTKSTAASKPEYTQSMLEAIMGRKIIDADTVSRGIEATSVLHTYRELGVMEQVDPGLRARLERDAEAVVVPC